MAKAKKKKTPARAAKKSLTKKKLVIKKAARKVAKKPATKKRKVTPIPKGYHTVTPYLTVSQGKDAIAFYKSAFNAKAVICMEHADGKIGHAELTIGDSKIMLSDECPEMHAYGPLHFHGSPICIHLYVKDVDAFVKRAVSSGATLIRPVENQFYGDRSGGLEDPFGHKWYVSTRIENLTNNQIKKRAVELFGKK
jgi:PhnB protein